eukprot:115367-Lingulodinium_polyedra.AAC.1
MEAAAREVIGEPTFSTTAPDVQVGGLLREGLPLPVAGPGRPLVSVYVDNGTVFGLNRTDTQEGLDLFLAALRRRKFIVHEVEDAARSGTPVGI